MVSDKSRAPFEIVEMPDGKFTLRWGEYGQAGPFIDRRAAEEAMKRVIESNVYCYDAKGVFIP